MRKLSVFNFVTLNGFYKGPNGDISWHKHGPEETEFSIENLRSGGTLLFGRLTYELMVNYWTNPAAVQQMPIIAEGMNNAPKIVFSNTLDRADWNNTTLIKENMLEFVRQMKQMPGKDMTLLGSGKVLTQLAEHGLIDEYKIMIDPTAIGQGTPLFEGIQQPLNLVLTDSEVFKTGVICLYYRPASIFNH